MSLFQLFSKIPNEEVINEALEIIGFNCLENPKVIFRKQITDNEIQNFIEFQNKLKEYYMPCKAKVYIKDTNNAKNIITIIRHLLKTIDYSIKSKEKYIKGSKTIMYQIEKKADSKTLNKKLTICFD